MKFLKRKNLKNRKFFNKIEIKKKLTKFLFTNFLNSKKTTPKNKAFFCYFLIKILKQNKKFKNSKTKIYSRCIVTNRAKSVYKPFGLSRIIFREYIQIGLIPGYLKAVW